MEHDHEERTGSEAESKVIRFQRSQISKETGSDDIMEEYANELAIPYTASPAADIQKVKAESVRPAVHAETPREKSYPWLGVIALTMAILAMFVYPTLFGSGAALLGFFAFLAGHRALGVWSIVLGLIALAGYFLLVPLYA